MSVLRSILYSYIHTASVTFILLNKYLKMKFCVTVFLFPTLCFIKVRRELGFIVSHVSCTNAPFFDLITIWPNMGSKNGTFMSETWVNVTGIGRAITVCEI